MTSRHYLDRWHQNVSVGIFKPAALGLFILVAAVFGFGVWAATAQLSAAAVARGTFIATGSNKTIQHLEGGIIREIRVSEGQLVRAGATLMVLDDTAARAELRRLLLRRYTQLAIGARLDLERNASTKLEFPAELTTRLDDSEVAAIVASQMAEFSARKEQLESRIKVIRDRIEAIHQEIRGIDAQKVSVETQLKLLDEEIKANKTLLAKGLVKRPRFLALQRAYAQLDGTIGKHEADRARARERIAEAESQIVQVRSEHKEKTVTLYRESRTELDDVNERIKTARDVLSRLEIAAPIRGVVVKLHHNTIGGVVQRGEDILELLPADEQLLVEAKVMPEDIDQVTKGLTAQLRLVALNQRTTPMVEGKVIYVSADSIEGKRPEDVYYVARIDMDQDSLAKVENLKIAPGMPVEVFIQTGQRTFFEYLMKPLTDSFARAFKET